jgi:xanthine dehydrogenase YagS FAD-binding subunit
MKAFTYLTAASAESAAQLTSKMDSALLGSGNDLLGRMKEGVSLPDRLVSVKNLPELRNNEAVETVWEIGAAVTVAEIAAHRDLAERFPGLVQAAEEVGSPQIRNVATLGGNLAQHSRCWYYRHRDVPCLKKGGDQCYAREGENKFHSLFSGNPCISPVVSNLATALTALGAHVKVRRKDKVVAWSLAELYHGAWENPEKHHSLEPGDVILGVMIPLRPAGRLRSAYLQVSEKAAFDWALVSCAAAVELDGGKVKSGRVVLGCIAPVPHMTDEANALLVGKTLDEATVSAVADALLSGAKPRAHNGYKVPLAKALVKRTLLRLAA